MFLFLSIATAIWKDLLSDEVNNEDDNTDGAQGNVAI